MGLDWKSNEVEVLLNPKMTKSVEIERKLREVKRFDGHVWLATSGSRKQKFVALSKQAILVSAQAVNQFLESTAKDIWFDPLPLFHVGGLSIWARAHLSGAGIAIYPDVTKQRWNVQRFYEALTKSHATLASVVPTQLYDIVTNELTAPKPVRALLVGGGGISDTLFNEAVALGWPVCPTYGLTECASQVATAYPKTKELHLLPHVEAMIDESGTLALKSPALFTAYATELTDRMFIEDPKQAGWFRTSDIAELNGNQLKVLGRIDDVVKISGETVLLTALEKRLEELLQQSNIRNGVTLVTSKDERLGLIIEAMAERTLSRETVEQIVVEYNKQVMPFERIKNIQWVEKIPRNVMGKMIRKAQDSTLVSHNNGSNATQ